MHEENFTFKVENWRDPDLPVDLRKAGLAFLDHKHGGSFILDLSTCKSVNSRTIGTVVLLQNKFNEHKKDMRITNVPYDVWKIFDLMNLTAVLNMDDPIEAAAEDAHEPQKQAESSAPTLKVDFENYKGVGVFIFSGKIHSSQDSAAFLNIINKIIQDKERMLIDMKGVKYIDSLAMGVLSRLVKLTHEGKALVRFCGASEMLMEIFKSGNLDRIITIHGSRDEALEGWK